MENPSKQKLPKEEAVLEKKNNSVDSGSRKSNLRNALVDKVVSKALGEQPISTLASGSYKTREKLAAVEESKAKALEKMKASVAAAEGSETKMYCGNQSISTKDEKWRKQFSQMKMKDLPNLPIKYQERYDFGNFERFEASQEFIRIINDGKILFVPGTVTVSKSLLLFYLAELSAHFRKPGNRQTVYPVKVLTGYSIESKNTMVYGILDYAIVRPFKGELDQIMVVIAEVKEGSDVENTMPRLLAQMYAVQTNYTEPRLVYGIVHDYDTFCFLKLHKDRTWQHSAPFVVGDQYSFLMSYLIHMCKDWK